MTTTGPDEPRPLRSRSARGLAVTLARAAGLLAAVAMVGFLVLIMWMAVTLGETLFCTGGVAESGLVAVLLSVALGLVTFVCAVSLRGHYVELIVLYAVVDLMSLVALDAALSPLIWGPVVCGGVNL